MFDQFYLYSILRLLTVELDSDVPLEFFNSISGDDDFIVELIPLQLNSDSEPEDDVDENTPAPEIAIENVV